VAFVVVKAAEDFDPQAKIESQIPPGFPVILSKEGEVIGAVLMIETPPPPKLKSTWPARAFWKSVRPPETPDTPAVLTKKTWPLKTCGNSLSRLTRVVIAAKTEHVGTLHPANGIDEVVVILGLELIGRGVGPI